MVAISPAIALITLAGWNGVASRFAHVSHQVRVGCATVIMTISAWCNFVYADGAEWSRDAQAIEAVHQQFQMQTTQPAVTRLVWSKPYACILFNGDPWQNPALLTTAKRICKHCETCPQAH